MSAELGPRGEGREPAPEIQTPLQYAADFAREASMARERVWTQAMLFQTNHGSSLMFKALHAAAKRGLDVRFTYDKFSEAERDGKMVILPTRGEVKVRQREVEIADNQWHQKLRDAGADVVITNPSKLIKIAPVFGRNHIKLSIVDNIAWFGGVNPASDHFERADFMVKIRDPDVVAVLSGLFTQVNEERPRDDYEVEINGKYHLYVDSGRRGCSIIYDKAIWMVENARSHIQFLSQIPPSGRLLGSLVNATSEGLGVDIILSDEIFYSENTIPFGLLKKLSYRNFRRVVDKYPKMRVHGFKGNLGKVHAKVLIADAETDVAKALWGSHNLSPFGVYAGTQEASMVTTDKVLVGKLARTFNSIKDGKFDLGFQRGPFNPQGFVS